MKIHATIQRETLNYYRMKIGDDEDYYWLPKWAVTKEKDGVYWVPELLAKQHGIGRN